MLLTALMLLTAPKLLSSESVKISDKKNSMEDYYISNNSQPTDGHCDRVPLVKPTQTNSTVALPRTVRWKGLVLPLLGGSLLAALVVFLVGAIRAEHQSKPFKILFKDCKSVCNSQKQQRIDKFGGDVLNTRELLRLVSAARNETVNSLKVDYGEKYFSEIFEETVNGKLTFRKAIVSGNVTSTEKLKRKFQMKILQFQKMARTQSTSVNEGCDCVAHVDGAASDQQTGHNSGRLQRQLLNNLQNASLPSSIEEALVKFIWTTGGHSAAAGHGNLYNESYTAFMEKAVKKVFAAAGIEFNAKNYAMGGMGSAIEIAFCTEAIFGSDTDAVSWDYGMTDYADYKMFLYNNRASLIPSRPALFGIHISKAEQKEIYFYFESNGLAGFILDPSAEVKMHESIPDCAGLTTDQINALPPLVRNFKCDGKIENGEPYCAAEKYSNAICPDREGKASWHPGWKDHAIIGNALAIFLMETLIEAVQDLMLMPGDPNDVLQELQALETADYARFAKSDLPNSLWGFNDPQYGEMEKLLTAVNRTVFYRSNSICHTGLLPAETRYQGHLTESDKRSRWNYDEGQNRQEVDSNPPAEKDKSPMRLVSMGHRQVCPVLLNVDYKDYFYASHADGWATLTVPNDSEARAYRYDSSAVHGVILVCQGHCDWGSCPEGNLSWEDMSEGKASFEVNGKPVVKLSKFDHCRLLEGENGFKWRPNGKGKFVVRVRVNVEKSFVRLSAFILL